MQNFITDEAGRELDLDAYRTLSDLRRDADGNWVEDENGRDHDLAAYGSLAALRAAIRS